MLASASLRRVDLLAQIGVAPTRVIAANIDETPRPREVPSALAKRLAVEKATAIARQEQDALVLAADTVVSVGRRILPKTENAEEARACLHLMSGAVTACIWRICLIDGARRWQRLVTNLTCTCAAWGQKILRLIWRPVNGRARPAGYAIQGHAAAFISQIIGSYSNIVGLPLFETANLLQAAGFRSS